MGAMEVMKVSSENLEKVVREAVIALKKGKVLVCPTDTIYGFIADAANAKAVEKIFRIKKRSKKKPLGVFVENIAAAKKIAKINKRQEKFLKKVWPGKVTVVLENRGKFPRELGVTTTIGIRIPKHAFLQLLLQKFKNPIVQTSVNISEKPPLRTVKEVIETFSRRKNRPDLIIDAGSLPFSLPSSVIDLTAKKPGPGRQKILRRGA